MKFLYACVITPFIFLSCRYKDSTEDDLKNAMQTYLYGNVNNDSSNVKYDVEKVVYYDDKLKNKYICIFTVRLKELINTAGKMQTHFDTTGEMKAYISKDFKTVKRLY